MKNTGVVIEMTEEEFNTLFVEIKRLKEEGKTDKEIEEIYGLDFTKSLIR